MHNPTIAIMTPAFDAGCFVNETIEKVLALMSSYWEGVIMGVGSTDKAPEWMASTGIRHRQWPDSSRIVERSVGGTKVVPARLVLNGRVLKPRLR